MIPDGIVEQVPVLCVLGLGSNRPCGDVSCEELLLGAAAELKKHLSQFRLSPLYKTAPVHITDQPPFINAAASGFFSFIDDTDKPGAKNSSPVYAARKLLGIIQGIEAQYGRDRSAERRWGERTLDIDILLFGNCIIREHGLIIPHPRLAERAFALRPLLDLLPDAVEPDSGKRYDDFLAALGIQEVWLHDKKSCLYV